MVEQKKKQDTFSESYLQNKKNEWQSIVNLFNALYFNHHNYNASLIKLDAAIDFACNERSEILKKRDSKKSNNKTEPWFLSNTLCGMSLYVDRFCGDLKNIVTKLNYLDNLGINLLHLMPLFKSPEKDNDGGYAVSDFRVIDKRFGTLEDLKNVQNELIKIDKYLMLDIVLNHTADTHEWALKAKAGEKKYQDYFYIFDNRNLPDEFEKTMPEVFPEAAPGNFTYIKELDKWIMTVFHNYQWDLNFTNPEVFIEMLENVFFYANLGVDVLRIDAPAFVWKKLGTNCQNLDEAHIIIQLLKKCVKIATPGMALLAEAIVAPKDVMKYFGTGNNMAKESDLAYNATQMALQWDALATGDVRVMLQAQELLLTKPYGTSWISYTRCHDDIGFAYDDYMINKAGFDPHEHRIFLKKFYTGNFHSSLANGILFSENEKTGDARVSGTLASLCGLEKAIALNDYLEISKAVNKIILMQSFSFFIGGIPMLFYGDDLGYTNDYTYQQMADKNYDNRWIHRPLMDWKKNEKFKEKGTIENLIFSRTRRMLALRKKLTVISDKKNLTWIETDNHKIAGYLRAWDNKGVCCYFNFSNETTVLNKYVFNFFANKISYDYISDRNIDLNENLVFMPYQFFIIDYSL